MVSEAAERVIACSNYEEGRYAKANQRFRWDAGACALLTPREREVLDTLAQGMGSKHAARQLRISYETIRTHQRNIYKKLGVRSLCSALNVYRSKRVMG